MLNYHNTDIVKVFKDINNHNVSDLNTQLVFNKIITTDNDNYTVFDIISIRHILNNFRGYYSNVYKAYKAEKHPK